MTDIDQIPAALAEFWQPAETAPRDGTNIIGLFESIIGYEAGEVYYAKTSRCWKAINGAWSDDAMIKWMPLPAVKG